MVHARSVVPDGYFIRSATLDDVEAVTEVYRADEEHYAGYATMTAELVRGDWTTPDRDLSRDAWVAETHDGRIVAVADIGGSDGIRLWGGAVVHPAYTGHGLATALQTLVEARARELAQRAPEGVRSSFAAHISPHNNAARTFLEGRGYTYTRSFWEMGIDLEGREFLSPVLPPSLRIRTLIPGQDDRAAFEATEEAFADHWGHTPGNYTDWRHWVLENDWSDPSLLFLTVEGTGAGEQIAGVALCSRMFGPETGYVNTLGVRRPWRHLGVGRALMLHAFAEFARRGAREVTLGVDAQSLTGATRLYESVGMSVRSQADRYELEVRAGRDIGTRELVG